MNYGTARARFIKGLKVRYHLQTQIPLYGEVDSVRPDPADQNQALVNVRLNSGRLSEFNAQFLQPTEGTFRCDFCHQERPQHCQRKIFGCSYPRCCDKCRAQGERFMMQRAQGGKGGV